MTDPSIAGVLRERASLQPHDEAFTFLDYDTDPDGVARTLTWGELFRQCTTLAAHIRDHAEPGDRVVILAPQSMEYVLAFLSCFVANVVSIPLSEPAIGVRDERIGAVMRDAAPTVILTTSAVAAAVAPYADADPEHPATVLEVDRLDLEERRRLQTRRETPPAVAYLQYTSGSTRVPAGVMVTQRNLFANFEQQVGDIFTDHGKVAPAGTTTVSWLPFFHDMGLILGIVAPILGGWPSVIMSPMSFLMRPARWMQQLARRSRALTAAPNFALDLAGARTTDEDLAGLDLGGVLAIICGAERVQPATLDRFTQRFARFSLSANIIRPSYGLAEATLFVATRAPGAPPKVTVFDTDRLNEGHAVPAADGTALIGYGRTESPRSLIVDPDTRCQVDDGRVGEIWVHGDNVCAGYWHKPAETEQTFGAVLDGAAADTPSQNWLRTGDLGFVDGDDLYIIGRIKDLLIVRGRNHYPDDIEATVGAVSGGRVAAISVDNDGTEQLVAIIETRARRTDDETREAVDQLKGDVTTAIAAGHGINAADLVVVGRGAIPITTSGKIRRRACAEQYRLGQFVRLDA